MIILFTPRMMDMTVQETLTALIKDVFEGLARFGCALEGIYYEDERLIRSQEENTKEQ